LVPEMILRCIKALDVAHTLFLALQGFRSDWKLRVLDTMPPKRKGKKEKREKREHLFKFKILLLLAKGTLFVVVFSSREERTT